ncbi:hypothetical protein Nepgr_016375 [Nepenthes gracilis]|uniref:Leucine-rich repeat-containing N-terminal plant-type domain-containing protein n=1 Tax=Nepenthes gracilis TaxID=150966 RepID=A0AAD3XS09_NEPGR|nr:hypothetical protein Nepgr_016375 [Nepenthes gracilis]
MVCLLRLTLRLLCLYLHSRLTTSSPSPNASAHLCHEDERFAMLEFKNSLSSDDSSVILQLCASSGQVSYAKTASWKAAGSDCCQWDGVTCNPLTGHIVGLDLSCGKLQGTIPTNSTLFTLRHLQSLNLAFNGFFTSRISPEFGRFPRLKLLNLSTTFFTGEVPLTIAQLPQLASLDLSQFDNLGLELPNFDVVIGNLTRLRELHLDSVQVNSNATTLLSLTNLSTLMALSLSGCNFFGPLPSMVDISKLSRLTVLDLSANLLDGKVPSWLFSLPSLNKLYLDDNGFSGQLTIIKDVVSNSSLANLSSLMVLSLSNCNFFGPLPAWIWTIIREIHLSGNQFTGELPSMIDISKLSQLTVLDLSGNLLDGEVPSWLFNLPSLNKLYLDNNQFSNQQRVIEDVASNSSLTNLSSLMVLSLSYCNFSGPLPAWIWNIIQEIRLSGNRFTGELPPRVDISKLSQLTVLDLSENLLDGEVPSWLFSLPSLNTLYLANNQFSGQLDVIEDVASNNTTMLEYIDLSGNKIQGSIPNSIFELVSLETLKLSSNNLSGIIELDMFCKLENLTELDMSNNGLTLLTKSNGAINSNVAACRRLTTLLCSPCNIIEFPDFLRNQEDLQVLDLSNNKIHGDIPKWAQDIGRYTLYYLNLSHNFLTGSLDLLQWKNLQFIDIHSNMFEGPAPILPSFTVMLSASYNNFVGEMPSAICTLASLEILDLSYNSLSGEIPRCFKNFSDQLSVLDLRSNKLHGTLSSSFEKCSSLRTLNLNGNQLGGQLPLSLLSCQGLEVLDVGNNNFKGTFPYWLGSLPKLQVLILHSNSFFGNLGTSKAKHLFSKLRILDLSNNGFNGTLSSNLLHCFKAMMNSTENRGQLQYLGDRYYTDSVMLEVKGHDLNFIRILNVITTIDVSNNKLEGEIPEVIGDLVSLRWLNLAHNNFMGRIPPSLVRLSELESLDLSSNKLVGRIPGELASLTFLEFFNVSQNRLVGPIPQGKQFATFGNNSYSGNLGLCGNPLSKKCSNDEASSQPPSRMVQDGNDSEYKGAFDWTMAGIGYGCGTVIGLAAGYYIIIARNPIWLLRLARPIKNATNQLF